MKRYRKLYRVRAYITGVGDSFYGDYIVAWDARQAEDRAREKYIEYDVVRFEVKSLGEYKEPIICE